MFIIPNALQVLIEVKGWSFDPVTRIIRKLRNDKVDYLIQVFASKGLRPIRDLGSFLPSSFASQFFFVPLRRGASRRPPNAKRRLLQPEELVVSVSLDPKALLGGVS